MGKGKRNSAIVISSDDDKDEDFVSRTNFRFANSVPIKKSRKRAKRVSLPNSGYSDFSGFDEVKKFCEEFDQGLTQFKVSSGSDSDKDLWVNKYKPRSLEELAVHKKKVEELKMWFEERLRNSDDNSRSNVILVSGQAGAGKSATIYAVASHLGAEVCEWTTPTPTIWQEHLHASSSGLRYMSKLDEFEIFVEKIRKYGIISSSLTRVSSASVIILIDDLPVVNGKISCGRLHRCLHLLLQSVRLPTAILINEYGKTDAAEHHARYWEELQSSLQNAGALRVTFNPITVNSIRKILLKICKVELFEVSDEQINLIANTSGGDIRHAITSLQYFSLKPHPVDTFSVSTRLLAHSEEKANETRHLNEVSLPFGKDATLSLFHALGKFLHNKRESESSNADRDAILLKDKFVRNPLKMDAPELVLSQAHGEARLVADFLHENVLDFVNEDAIEDAGVVAAYLSDADLLIAPQKRALIRKFEAENIIQSVAASIAVRGVLFGNTHPVSSRWHAIRRPQLWKVEQSLWHNKYDMETQTRDVSRYMSLNSLSVMATEFKPALKWLGHRLAAERTAEDDDYDGMCLDDEVKESDDDDIEEW